MAHEEKTVLVAVADGTEELEAVAVIDTLRRAGAKVVVGSVSGKKQVTCSRGVQIVADELVEAVADSEFDLIVCPGGMPGAKHLAESQVLTSLLQKHAAPEKNSIVAGICAAPAIVLEPLGILNGKTATCFPSFASKLTSTVGGCSEERVVVDASKRVVTSRGPGTALEFALKLVELLYGKPHERKVAEPMMTHL